MRGWSRALVVAVALLSPLGGATAVSAGFPDKPIELQVTFPPGGPTDTEARILAKYAEGVFGQRLVILNVAGAGGISGWNNVPKAQRDGYWLTTYNLPHIFAQPLVVKEARFTERDFIPLVHWANDPTVVAVRADSPYRTIEDLIADARAHPGTVTLGMAGRYLGHHLAVLQLEDAAKIKLRGIAFKGSAPSIAALLGGQTKAIADNLSDMLRQGRRVRMLAIATAKRHRLAPEVPTFAEKGYPDVLMSSDRGAAAPAGLPAAIVKTLADGLWRAVQTKGFRDDMRKAGVDLVLMRGAELAQYWRDTDARIEALLRRLKLTTK